MKAHIIIGLIIIAGIINILPLMGVLSAGKLSSAYGVSITDPTLELLLRHRAVLFGLIGGLMIYGAFRPGWHSVIMIIGAISMASFVVLAQSISGWAPEMKKIIAADCIGLAALAVACALKLWR